MKLTLRDGDPYLDGDRYSTPFAPARGVTGGSGPRQVVWGADLRARLTMACRDAGRIGLCRPLQNRSLHSRGYQCLGQAYPRSPESEPELDAVQFLGPRRLSGEVHRVSRGTVTVAEHVARLAGAIRQSTADDVPGWFRRAIRGDVAIPHTRGNSRTWESREVALATWEAVARHGYSLRRVIRAVDHVRRVCWVRWGIAVSHADALRGLRWHGRRQAVFAALMINATGRAGWTRGLWDAAAIAGWVQAARLPRRERKVTAEGMR
jgi:hypothetical protein